MLLYLLKVLDGAWPLFLGPPLLLRPLWAGDPATGGDPGPAGPGGRGRPKALGPALALGALSALAYAILKRNTGWVVREYYDIWILWPLLALFALFLVSLVASSRRGAPGWARLGLRASAPAACCLLVARCLPDLLVAPLDFDAGLGSALNMTWLSRAAGYAIGLALLALLFLGASFLLRRLGRGAAALVVALSALALFSFLAADALRIMYVRRILLTQDWVATAVIFVSARPNLFLFLELGIFAAAALYRLGASALARPVGANPALLRKSRYGLALDRRAAVFLLLCLGAALFAAQTLRAVEARGPVIPEPDEVFAEDGAIALDLAVVGDGNLHRYVWMAPSGTGVRFIVIRKTANAYGVGLDACDICGATGYYQRGDQVICKLCDVVMNKTTIGFPGGCNPVPLGFRIEGGALVIDPKDLEAEVRRFS